MSPDGILPCNSGAQTKTPARGGSFEVAIQAGLMQQQRLLHRHGTNRHQCAGQQAEQQHAQAIHAQQKRGIRADINRRVAFRRVEIHQLDDAQVVERTDQR